MTYNVKLELIQYSNDVINNKIVACKAHKLACKRFLYDIEREGTDEFPYVFDSQRAYKFFKWTALFKHSKGILAESTGRNSTNTAILIRSTVRLGT